MERGRTAPATCCAPSMSELDSFDSEDIAANAWGALWGPAEPVPFKSDDNNFLYWECYPEAKARMGVHRAVGYFGPRPMVVVTSRWGWGLAWKMLKADVRVYNAQMRRMRGGD